LPVSKESTVGYGTQISEEHIAEIKKLRFENPRIWNIKALTHMLKIKPESILKHAQLPPAKKLELNAEKNVIESMTRLKRRRLLEKRLWDQVAYVSETRGAEEAKQFRRIMEPLDVMAKRMGRMPPRRPPNTDRIAPHNRAPPPHLRP